MSSSDDDTTESMRAEPPSAPPATPVGLGTQEVRFATAMTGGVSLAVWMGGVARELNLLEQASRLRETLQAGDPLPSIEHAPDPASAPGALPPDPIAVARAHYLRLLDLLDLTTHTDVLSGTSAGGINAALLGFTRAKGLDLGLLRDVWLSTGSFDLLLRDPGEHSPPSLLQGDGVLLQGLNDGIAELVRVGRPPAPAPAAPPSPPPTTVFVTTTVLAGETSRFVDDFGTRVQDVEHRGLFRFDQGQLAAPANQGALALAARSSASFPGAFEPAFVPIGTKLDAHPDMAEFSNTTRSHFVADGGLLMNRPIKPLIEEVFDRPADRQVRRVLLYVVPSPGELPDPNATPPAEKYDAPLTFGGALLQDLGAILGQSIGAELRTIRQHNDAVTGIADTRLRVAELGWRVNGSTLTLLRPEALADYRERQSRALASPIATALMRGLTTMPAEKMPGAWKQALAPDGHGEADCRHAIVARIAEPWSQTVPPPAELGPIAAFGRAPLDGAKAAVVAMFRAGWALTRSASDREQLAAATTAVHAAMPDAPLPNFAQVVADALATITNDSTTTLATVARQVASTVEAARNAGDLAAGWENLAQAVIDAAPLLGRLATPPSGSSSTASTAEEIAARHELRTYLDFLGQPDVPPAPGDELAALQVSPEMIATSLFQLHVITRSMLPTTVETEQRLELVQVSADTRSNLTPDHQFATDKLTGLQLHHFGAFYKSSWRANDWMWGRLDGAGWLVHVLLDPRRIQVLADEASRGPGFAGAGTGTGAGPKAQWFLDRVRDRFPALPKAPVAAVAELAYLDQPGSAVPQHLAEVSMWVATVFQQRIAVAELPVVAREVLLNPTLHDSSWAVDVLQITNTPQAITTAAQAVTQAMTNADWTKAQEQARALVEQQPQPVLSDPAREQLLIEKLKSCPVPAQTLEGEVGEPLFTRTVTKAVAVTAAATAEAQELPTVVKPALGTVRKMTLLAYRLAAVNGGNARSLALGGALLAVVGFVMLATSHVVLGITGVVVMGAGIYLLLLASWRNLRNWRDIAVFVVTGLVVIVFGALFADGVRDWLFDVPGGDKNQGVVSEHVLPWLRSPAWHAPVAWAIFAALVAGIVATIWVLVKKRKECEEAQAPPAPTPSSA